MVWSSLFMVSVPELGIFSLAESFHSHFRSPSASRYDSERGGAFILPFLAPRAPLRLVVLGLGLVLRRLCALCRRVKPVKNDGAAVWLLLSRLPCVGQRVNARCVAC